MADEMTLQEIADEMKISRERVRQIIERAFIRIRKRLRAMGVNGYSDISIEEALSQAFKSGKRPSE